MFRYGSEILGWSFYIQAQRQWFRTASSYTGINILRIVDWYVSLIGYLAISVSTNDIRLLFIEKTKIERVAFQFKVCVMIAWVVEI